jgi:hypothetical protein
MITIAYEVGFIYSHYAFIAVKSIVICDIQRDVCKLLRIWNFKTVACYNILKESFELTPVSFELD